LAAGIREELDLIARAGNDGQFLEKLLSLKSETLVEVMQGGSKPYHLNLGMIAARHLQPNTFKQIWTRLLIACDNTRLGDILSRQDISHTTLPMFTACHQPDQIVTAILIGFLGKFAQVFTKDLGLTLSFKNDGDKFEWIWSTNLEELGFLRKTTVDEITQANSQLGTALLKMLVLIDTPLRESFPMKLLHHRSLAVFEGLLNAGFFSLSPLTFEVKDTFGWTLVMLAAAKYPERILVEMLRQMEEMDHEMLNSSAMVKTTGGMSLLLIVAVRHSRQLLLSMMANIKLGVLLDSFLKNPLLPELHRLISAEPRLRELIIAGAREQKDEVISIDPEPGTDNLPNNNNHNHNNDNFLPSLREQQRVSAFLVLVSIFVLLVSKLEQHVRPEGHEEEANAYFQYETDFLELLRLIGKNEFSLALSLWRSSSIGNLMNLSRLFPLIQIEVIIDSWFRERAQEAFLVLKDFLNLRGKSSFASEKELDLISAALKTMTPNVTTGGGMLTPNPGISSNSINVVPIDTTLQKADFHPEEEEEEEGMIMENREERIQYEEEEEFVGKFQGGFGIDTGGNFSSNDELNIPLQVFTKGPENEN